MTLSRHSSKIYLDEYDVRGVMNVLDRITDECPKEAQKFYMGAYLTFSILLEATELRDQSVFIDVFNNALKEIDVLEGKN